MIHNHSYIVPNKFKIFFEQCIKNDSMFNKIYQDFDLTINKTPFELAMTIMHYITSRMLFNQKLNGDFDIGTIVPDKHIRDLLLSNDVEIITFDNLMIYVMKLYKDNIFAHYNELHIKYDELMRCNSDSSDDETPKRKVKHINQDNTIKKGLARKIPVPKKFKVFYNKYVKKDPVFLEKFNEIWNFNDGQLVIFNINKDQPRTTITKIIYWYIARHELYQKNDKGVITDKRKMKPDKALTELFDIKDGEELKMYNFQSYLNRMYGPYKNEHRVNIENLKEVKQKIESDSDDSDSSDDNESEKPKLKANKAKKIESDSDDNSEDSSDDDSEDSSDDESEKPKTKKAITKVKPRLEPQIKNGLQREIPVPEKFMVFYNKYIKNDVDFDKKYVHNGRDPNYICFDINKNQSRTTITKIIYWYITKLELYQKNNEGVITDKRNMKTDEALTELFDIKDGEELHMTNFQTYVSRIYNDKKNDAKPKEIAKTKKYQSDSEDSSSDDESENEMLNIKDAVAKANFDKAKNMIAQMQNAKAKPKTKKREVLQQLDKIPEKFKQFYESHLKNMTELVMGKETLIFPPELFDIDKGSSKATISNMIYRYIKDKNLISVNKRDILVDDVIKNLLSIKDDESVNIVNFNTYIGRLYDL
jgi:hypothetical protein